MNLELLQRPFLPDQIRQREGRTGALLDYVEGHVVIGRLNEALAGKWSFEVLEHRILPEADEVLVLGRLSAEGIIKTQFGSSPLTKHRHSGDPVSIGDDLKAAATDALKKCATLLGVALDLYQGSRSEVPKPTPAPSGTSQPTAPVPERAGNSGRLTAKQLQLVHKLAGERRVSRTELTQHCQDRYGRVPDFLTKAQASNLIDELMAGQVQIPAQTG